MERCYRGLYGREPALSSYYLIRFSVSGSVANIRRARATAVSPRQDLDGVAGPGNAWDMGIRSFHECLLGHGAAAPWGGAERLCPGGQQPALVSGASQELVDLDRQRALEHATGALAGQLLEGGVDGRRWLRIWLTRLTLLGRVQPARKVERVLDGSVRRLARRCDRGGRGTFPSRRAPFVA
jgi:hypothetical protein